jgi:hypothetical protein
MTIMSLRVLTPHLVVPLERYHSNHENPDCRAYKLLGIYLDETLNFNHHTNFLCNKLNRSLFCMRRAKNLLSHSALKTLYFAFIQSHLNYCPIILSSISQQNFNQIKLIQKKAIRIITGLKVHCSYCSSFRPVANLAL